ncbi:DUF2294 domain-containing protein [Paenibacillus sp. SYP-B4298]|uniref:DUF2294 domain-containing protein n=1 Tax=Paenibacillus sp. SYP-B4298 TaxID=2996034 RepID=UPI0022DDF5B9|nr:Na-translocating system protein MpsC family protein [Paenibacillus sp. SYP-B4298]
MSQQINQHQQLIASYTGKLLRDFFGKGPESVFVSLGGNVMAIYLRNFITPTERVLLEQGHEAIIHDMRDRLMETMVPEIADYVENLTENRLEEIYYDWNVKERTMMLLGLFRQQIPGIPPLETSYTGQLELERELRQISHSNERAPDTIISFELNPRILVVIRQGILLGVEKELIRHGQGELLKRIKKSMEKERLLHNSNFDFILNKRVQDCFVDWNYEQDKSAILLVTGNR